MISAIITIANALAALPKLVEQIQGMIEGWKRYQAQQDAAAIDAISSEIAKIKPGTTKEEIDASLKAQLEALQKLRGPVGRIGQ
jgi:hypothetical protein